MPGAPVVGPKVAISYRTMVRSTSAAFSFYISVFDLLIPVASRFGTVFFKTSVVGGGPITITFAGAMAARVTSRIRSVRWTAL